MKRYNWEYNGETMGLVERDNGICVLYSDVEELEAERDAALTENKRLRDSTIEECLSTLGHKRVKNPRCTARYKPPENPTGEQWWYPIWCDLTAGHEGPCKHASGHHIRVMNAAQIEHKPLADLCERCGTLWPCAEAEKVLK
jgi:hypothetical protein